MSAPLHQLGMESNYLQRHITSERGQKVLEIVAIGSVIAMGIGAVFQLYKEINTGKEREHYRNLERKMHEGHRR